MATIFSSIFKFNKNKYKNIPFPYAIVSLELQKHNLYLYIFSIYFSEKFKTSAYTIFFLIQITGIKTNYVICVSFLNKLNFCDVLYSIFWVKIQDLLKNIFVIVVVMRTIPEIEYTNIIFMHINN
jgi:hypothetical protein